MNGKERITKIIHRQTADRTAFWHGSPVEETKKIYYKYFQVNNELDLSSALGSDLFWIPVDWFSWKHPSGLPAFDTHGGRPKKNLGESGVFAECEDVREIEAFNWPNPDFYDYGEAMEQIKRATSREMSIFSGMWSYFFHIAADFFGMENYFVKMYTDPAVVEAVTEKIVDFYIESNKRFFDMAADKIDVFFMGNDMGSQRDLLFSVDLYKKFILPSMKRLINLAKSYDLKVAVHSCGAITKIIPLLIDAGVDILHPLQAKAAGMDAESLAREFKNDIIFMGGVDTQDILPFGTPSQVWDEVQRIKGLFGDLFIVSPSHEGVLPNISPQNMEAMRDSALSKARP